MKKVIVILVGLALLQCTNAQTSCGPQFNNATCGKLGPCCSEFWFCGATPAQCGGGCYPGFSQTGACLATRPNGQKCYSGLYKFDNQTWIVPSDAYNGNPQSADFTIDRQGLTGGNFRLGKTGGFQMELIKGLNDTTQAIGVRLSTTSYITLGSIVTARIKPTTAGGVVTAVITMADDKDEIDWEWTGDPANIQVAQSNFFSKGALDYTNSGKHPISTGNKADFHDFTIDWNAERLNWVIDGAVVRTSTAAQLGAKYPISPARFQLAVWDGTQSEGTRNWAGGFINWALPAANRTATVELVRVQCAGDPAPATTPVRPAGFYPPYIFAAPVTSVVEGVTGYDAEHTGFGKKSLANLASEIILNNGAVKDNKTGTSLQVDKDGKVVGLTPSTSKGGVGSLSPSSVILGIVLFTVYTTFNLI
ncbi:hypothetical protein HK098_002319 [Nowakowskiella sp. JEL0407]|nr:hypothetical protein HK098_002319 [Nowakowskiella sp. JEL0407]